MPYYNYNIDYLITRPNNISAWSPSEIVNFIWFVHIRLWIILDVLWLLDPAKYEPLFRIQSVSSDKIEQLRAFNKRALSIINGRKEQIYWNSEILSAIDSWADMIFNKFLVENKIKP